MSNVEIPKHARRERRFRAIHEGDTLQVTLYDGRASDGYKSDFERRPARWIEWSRYTTGGKRVVRQATRYGGNRYGKGLADYQESVRELRAAGVRVIYDLTDDLVD